MKKQHWIYIALVFLLMGIGVSIYLSMHHYSLLYGMAEGKSFCNVSQVVNCDAVNTSKYSEIFGIPVAIFGAFTFLVELLLLVGIKAFGPEERNRLARYFFLLALVNVAMSLYLGGVSALVLHMVCLFCTSLYAVSLVTFIAGWMLIDGPKIKLAEDLPALFRSSDQGGSRGVLYLLLVIPVASALAHGMWKQSISSEIDQVVVRSIEDWKANPVVHFDIQGAPTRGNPAAKFVIVEFSDFQCPHCKHAAPTLEAFTAAHKDDAYFIFQNYPLDPACNPKMKGGGHDQACNMAYAAMCAFKQGQFEKAHDWIFEHQETLSSDSPKEMADALGLDKNALEACMKDPATKDVVIKDLDRGDKAGVQGTPTVFVNGRLLPGGFLIPVLEAALKASP